MTKQSESVSCDASHLNAVVSRRTTHPLEQIHREGVFEAHIPPKMRAELLMDTLRHEYRLRHLDDEDFDTLDVDWMSVITNGIAKAVLQEKIRLLFAYAPIDHEEKTRIFMAMFERNEPAANIRSLLSYSDPNTTLRCKVGAWCDETSRSRCEAMFGHIGTWDVSDVTDMSCLFSFHDDDNFVVVNAFNDDISGWNVSNVTDMSCMFQNARSFDQNIGAWNVSNVTDMSCMFHFAHSFNQNVGQWNVSNVTSMWGMFCEAHSFNQAIGEWDVSNVTSMYGIFFRAHVFNREIGGWNMSNVTDSNRLFVAV